MSRTDWANILDNWPLRCPTCSEGALQLGETNGDVHIGCKACGASFPIQDEVAALFDFITRPELFEFTQGYQTIRRAEGYTGRGAAYYCGLPEHPANEPDSGIWEIRRKSFARLKQILSRKLPSGGTVLDLGSGNGWLSHQLAALGYRPMGMDINTDPDDGLAAVRHYTLTWPAVLTSFDQLPLRDDGVDMAIFNGSLHYSRQIAATLAETFRVLRPGGSIVIMDTPIYTNPSSGATMMEERQAYHNATHGIATNMPMQGYLTSDEIRLWETLFSCSIDVVRPWYGVRWAMRPLLARLRRTREPATFALIVLTKL